MASFCFLREVFYEQIKGSRLLQGKLKQTYSASKLRSAKGILRKLFQIESAIRVRCSECGRNFRRIKTRSGEILWKCAGQVEHTTDCHSRVLKQSEIHSYLSKLFQCNSDFADVYRHVECITVNAESFEATLK